MQRKRISNIFLLIIIFLRYFLFSEKSIKTSTSASESPVSAANRTISAVWGALGHLLNCSWRTASWSVVKRMTRASDPLLGYCGEADFNILPTNRSIISGASGGCMQGDNGAERRENRDNYRDRRQCESARRIANIGLEYSLLRITNTLIYRKSTRVDLSVNWLSLYNMRLALSLACKLYD